MTMECRQIDELMVDYLYRELDAAATQAFRAHVGTCARCGAELASLERTRKAMRAWPDEDPSPALTARLLHEAAKAVPSRAVSVDAGGLWGWLAKLFAPVAAHPALAAVASLVLVAGVAGYLTMRGEVTPETERPTSATADTTVPPGSPGPEPRQEGGAAPATAAPSTFAAEPSDGVGAGEETAEASSSAEAASASERKIKDGNDARGRIAPKEAQEKLRKLQERDKATPAQPVGALKPFRAADRADLPAPTGTAPAAGGGRGGSADRRATGAAQAPLAGPAEGAAASAAPSSPTLAPPASSGASGAAPAAPARDGADVGRTPAMPPTYAPPPPPAPSAAGGVKQERPSLPVRSPAKTAASQEREVGDRSAGPYSTESVSPELDEERSSKKGPHESASSPKEAPESKAEPKKGAEASPQKLHEEFRRAVSGGDCATAHVLRKRLVRYPEYYKRYGGELERDLKRCDNARRSRKNAEDAPAPVEPVRKEK